jgi:DNA-binding CsgD family transcriptional regulator
MSLREALLAELRQEVPALGRLSAQRLTDAILEVAQRFFPPLTTMKPGQLTWTAVRLSNGPGRLIEHTAFQPVTLDLALTEPWNSALRRQQRARVAAALFEQARAQGALLSTSDVGAILCTSPRSVASHVQAYQRTSGQLVPTRATVHDIGPGITHRLIICEKLLVEGRSVEQTAADTHHSVRAVTRYLKGFTRVRFCLEAGMTVEQTAFLTRMSAALVAKYQALHSRFAQRPRVDGNLDTEQPGRAL